MGTKIPTIDDPPPSIPGNNCAVCWGVGQPLGDDDTPKFIHVEVSGITEGPDWFAALGIPMSGDFELEQVGGSPCNYIETIGFRVIRVWFQNPFMAVLIEAGGGIDMFNGFGDSPCALEVLNGTSGFFESGSVIVSIPEIQP